MSRALGVALAVLCFATVALGKEAQPDQNSSQDMSVSQPHAVGKPVTTTTINAAQRGTSWSPVSTANMAAQRTSSQPKNRGHGC